MIDTRLQLSTLDIGYEHLGSGREAGVGGGGHTVVITELCQEHQEHSLQKARDRAF